MYFRDYKSHVCTVGDGCVQYLSHTHTPPPPPLPTTLSLKWEGGFYSNTPLVQKDSNIVGHVPREISQVCCWYCLQTSGSEITYIICGHRRWSKDWVVLTSSGVH